jgi:serine O-acetyltransferase
MNADNDKTNVAPPLPKGDRNMSPPDIGFWALLAEDYRTHDRKLLEQGFWAVVVHRYGNWRMGIRNKYLRYPFTLFYKFLNKFVEWTCGISLPYTVKLGRRVRLWHFGGMFLHARSIGNDVHLRQNTTFGVARTHHDNEIPTIEDRVDIGCGACVLGHVTIGHDSYIGANAVVLKDVPPHSVAVGLPAKVVKTLKPAAPEEHRDGIMAEKAPDTRVQAAV